MIKLAIEAQLPLVAARTRDTVNLGGTLKFLTGKTPQIWAGAVTPNALLLHLVTEANKQVLLPLEDLYSALTNASSTLAVRRALRVV